MPRRPVDPEAARRMRERVERTEHRRAVAEARRRERIAEQRTVNPWAESLSDPEPPIQRRPRRSRIAPAPEMTWQEGAQPNDVVLRRDYTQWTEHITHSGMYHFEVILTFHPGFHVIEVWRTRVVGDNEVDRQCVNRYEFRDSDSPLQSPPYPRPYRDLQEMSRAYEEHAQRALENGIDSIIVSNQSTQVARTASAEPIGVDLINDEQSLPEAWRPTRASAPDPGPELSEFGTGEEL